MSLQMMAPIALVACLILPTITSAEIPKGAQARIEEGVKAYHEEGPRAASEAWMKGGPLEGSTRVLTYANSLTEVQETYGSLEGYSVSKARWLSDRSILVYAVMNFNKGPLFCTYLLYQTAQETWVTTGLNFSTDVNRVWPKDVFVEK